MDLGTTNEMKEELVKLERIVIKEFDKYPFSDWEKTLTSKSRKKLADMMSLTQRALLVSMCMYYIHYVLQKHRPNGRAVMRSSLERKVCGSNFGPVK